MRKCLISVIALILCIDAFACTNFLVGKLASADGSTMVTYNMDAYGMCAKLRVVKAASHLPGETAEVWNYDDNILLGKIPQVPHTHGVVGFINDCQLSIVESTFVGREGQENPDGMIHYTALMQLALERASTAREAIQVMADLVAEYGYASSGETFSILDPDEVWIMEMMGKGADEKGAVWVAIRVPDDCVAAHANQSRIHKFDRKDKKNVMYSPDVISYARKKGFFTGKDSDFDFSKAYSPTNFHMQRACEARVWSIFNRCTEGFDKYLATVDGFHLDNYEEMPLYIKPDHKINLKEAIDMMRDHYEGTPFDMTADITGGPWMSPYRPRPQEFDVEGVTYYHERPIATQQSACVMLCQMRRWLPDPVGGVLWFANDDAAMVTYTPVYCSATEAPACYNDPDATDINFSWNSAFWICNWVSNMNYAHYSIMNPKLVEVREKLQNKYVNDQASVEAKAMNGDKVDIAYLESYSKQCAAEMLDAWKELGIHMVVMYNDLAIKPEKDGKFTTTPYGRGDAPLRYGYGNEYRKVIANETGDRYKSPTE